ncbi:hypothetical protein, partial [Blastomonas sp.]|uniref:hypothetical protein n=1 Tax=Blastomonas sp. TaxID=1909299 RepID=UPI0035933A61
MPKQPDPAETSAHPDDDQPVQPRASRLKRLLLLLLGIIVVLTALMLSTAPAVPPASAPNAADVTAASDALKDLTDKDTRRGQQIALTLDRQQLAGITALASQALSPARVTATLGPDKDAPESTAALTAHYSRPLLLGLWVNVRAEVHGMQDGVPDVTVRVGRLPLPRWLSRMAMQTAWGWAQDDAPDPLPLDEAIRSISVTHDAIRMVLVSPGRGAALAGLSRITGNTADGAAVATLYCALAATDTSDFTVLVRHAFAMPVTRGTSPVDHNRSTLIAIAMVAVPPYRERLAGTALPAIRACPA